MERGFGFWYEFWKLVRAGRVPKTDVLTGTPRMFWWLKVMMVSRDDKSRSVCNNWVYLFENYKYRWTPFVGEIVVFDDDTFDATAEEQRKKCGGGDAKEDNGRGSGSERWDARKCECQLEETSKLKVNCWRKTKNKRRRQVCLATDQGRMWQQERRKKSSLHVLLLGLSRGDLMANQNEMR